MGPCWHSRVPGRTSIQPLKLQVQFTFLAHRDYYEKKTWPWSEWNCAVLESSFWVHILLKLACLNPSFLPCSRCLLILLDICMAILFLAQESWYSFRKIGGRVFYYILLSKISPLIWAGSESCLLRWEGTVLDGGAGTVCCGVAISFAISSKVPQELEKGF